MSSAAPIAPPTVNVSKNAILDYFVAADDQWFYGLMKMDTGDLYLVASVDPESGKHATDEKQMKNILAKTQDQKHGGHGEKDFIGAGHTRAFVIDNPVANISYFTKGKKAACFAIKKTGPVTFAFVGNSGINEYMLGDGNRTLPDALQKHIISGLEAALTKHHDEHRSKCIIM
jgi:hypothetical protein